MPIKRIFIVIGLSLLCAGASVLLIDRADTTPEQKTIIESKLHSIVEDAEEEAHMILRNPDSVQWHLFHNSFFLIDSTEVIAWSTNQFYPDLRSINPSSLFQLSRSNSGDYLYKSWKISEVRTLVEVIPLTRKYPIANRYLATEWNEKIFGDWQGSILDGSERNGIVVNWNGQFLFRFQPADMNLERGGWSFGLACISMGCLMLGIFFLVRYLVAIRKYEIGFIILSLAFVLLRLAMVEIGYPSAWLYSMAFDHQYFASSSYNASIGDLFMNAIGILILCGYIFFTYYHWQSVRYVLRLPKALRYLMGTMFIVVSFFSFLYPFLFVETIFHNSSILLDITATIQFDGLRILSLLSLLAGAISAFFFVHVFINLAKSIFRDIITFFIALISAVLLFAGYFAVASHEYMITLPVAALFFLILYVTNLTSSLHKLEPISFIYFFVFIFALGIQHGFSVKYFTEEQRSESQIKFAANYLISRDVLGEYLLNESVKGIREDAFIQSRFNNPFLTKSAIRQKIKQVYLNAYFDRYESQIYLYNASGEPLDTNSPDNLSLLANRFRNTSASTDYNGIYFIAPSEMNINKGYLAFVSVLRGDQIVGYVIIELLLKRVIPQNVYPELLVDRRFAEFFENSDRSFCFIKDGKILSSFGIFNYERDFDFADLANAGFYQSGIRKNGFFHTGVEDVSGQVAVITSTAYPVFYMLTNFSFFFVLGVILLVGIMLIYGLESVLKGRKMNYAARIQLYIYLAFSLPLFVATITTLNRVSKSAEEELERTFEENARNLGDGLLPTVVNYNNGTIEREDFEHILIDQAKVANTDITFYNAKGKYVASSQPLIVESQIMSPLMNRFVYEKINTDAVGSFIEDERIGSLVFNNCYVTIKSPESGQVLGVLSVPFFDSETSLENTQVNVLANFLTVFTIIFILFSVLSFYVVNSLTFPLRFITRILSQTTLSGLNKPLEWRSNDEIGMMVSEYNKMVHNLEQSKIELSRSQKESAWREIAKQVAHEIKNPLTPMKLTLQQMETQLKGNRLNEEKARSSINTLLTQVDILNEIASSFSAFARMPAPILTRVELVASLNKASHLYSHYDEGKVTFSTALQTAYVMGDEQLFNRIFSNIILNGLQSGNVERITVQVELIRMENYYQISIKDNGRGMAPEMLNKVFIPYFSTKESGSGLGLAISKQGIEQSGGEIWFESEQGVGTTVYIKLPVVL